MPELPGGPFGCAFGGTARLARTEQRRSGSLAFQESSSELAREVSHRLYGTDDAMEAVLLGSVDEFDVGVRIDLQAFQDGWQIIRYAAALTCDDGAAGPVNQFKVVLGNNRTPTL